jgi:tetratricopeptide (TPR) repeat protein
MSKDLTVLLQGWDYNSNEVTVRRIIGADGREKIQMRLDLGVLQMEISGRPDGKRPHGFESLFHYHLAARDEGEGAESLGWSEWTLDGDACSDLKQEAMQYYYRYLSLFHLGDYHDVIRDTERNIQVFDLIRDFAEDEQDRSSLEQFRPYVLMMNARAKACLALEDKRYDRALEIIEDGVEAIRDFFRGVEREDLAELCREIQFLEEWRERIENNRPLTAVDRIRRELSMAVESEDYERAAELRDQLRAIAA